MRFWTMDQPKHPCSRSSSFSFDPRVNWNIFQVPFILTCCENTVFITFKTKQTHLLPHAEIIGCGFAVCSPKQETAALLPASDRVGIVWRCSGWPEQVAVEDQAERAELWIMCVDERTAKKRRQEISPDKQCVPGHEEYLNLQNGTRIRLCCLLLLNSKSRVLVAWSVVT